MKKLQAAKPSRAALNSLREIVRAAARALAKDGSAEAFRSLELILDTLGWTNCYTETTCVRLCAAISMLVGIGSYSDVLSAASQADIDLSSRTKRQQRKAAQS